MFYTILGIVVSIFVLAFICIMTGLYVRHRIRERRKDANTVLKKALTREVLQQRIDRAKAKKVNKDKVGFMLCEHWALNVVVLWDCKHEDIAT